MAWIFSSALCPLSGRTAGETFRNSELLSNPIAGLMIGVMATVLVQSSSTATSIVVALVASEGEVVTHELLRQEAKEELNLQCNTASAEGKAVFDFAHPPVLSALLPVLSASIFLTPDFSSLVPAPFLSLVPPRGMTFPFLSERNRLRTPLDPVSKQHSRHVVPSPLLAFFVGRNPMFINRVR